MTSHSKPNRCACGRFLGNRKGRIYCSKQCSNKAMVERRREQNKAKKKQEMLYCIGCNKKLTGRQTKWCSRKCKRDLTYRKHIKEIPIHNKNIRDIRIKEYCHQDGECSKYQGEKFGDLIGWGKFTEKDNHQGYYRIMDIEDGCWGRNYTGNCFVK